MKCSRCKTSGMAPGSNQYKSTCKVCSNTLIESKRKKKENELKKKWLGYETDMFKVIEFVGHFVKETSTGWDKCRRWYFKYQCKFCKNEAVLVLRKLDNLNNMRCQICKGSIKVDENLKKCPCCNEWLPMTEENFRFPPASVSTGGCTYFCKSCLGMSAKKSYEKRKANGKQKQYQQDYSQQRNARSRERWRTDKLYKMKLSLRGLTGGAFKNGGWTKDSSSGELLGCDWEVAYKHLEEQFVDDMSWDNYGKWSNGEDGWEIDHIKPLALGTTKEELIKLCHYTNLQPLWAVDNRSKGAKY